jgi:hypothetical protein
VSVAGSQAASGYTQVPPSPPPAGSQAGSGYAQVPSSPPPAGSQAASGYAQVPPSPPPAGSQAGSGYAQVPSSPPAAGSQAASGYTQVPSSPPPAGGTYAPAGSFAQPASVQAKGGGSALKIVLIIVAILVGIGILGAGAMGFMVWRVAHAIRQHAGQFSMSTPEGTVTGRNTANFTPEELGTDIYPGAQSTPGGMRMKLPSGSIVSGVFLTPDSKDQVLAFYKGKLGNGASVFDNPHSAMISLRHGSEESIIVSITSRPNENDGKTKISIVHTKTTHSS